MEDDGIFYGHLVHFTMFCYILWKFGIVRGNLVDFVPFCTKKNLATLAWFVRSVCLFLTSVLLNENQNAHWGYGLFTKSSLELFAL
jgi:hypothetical protein